MNLEASLHLLLSFTWTLTHPTINYLRQNIVFLYSEMIPVSSSFFPYFSFLCYVMLFCYYKFLSNCFTCIIINSFFSIKINLTFWCSGMFHVPVFFFCFCVFWRRGEGGGGGGIHFPWSYHAFGTKTISERFRQFYFFTKRSTLLLEKSRKINFLHLFFIEQHAKLLPFLLMLVDQVKS